jgi:tetraacyldisaccharide-1-P 4'-kinase
VVTVGGATIGGSGKTRVAVACVSELVEAGARRVALVGHAYRASPRRARIVAPSDLLAEVGDEALVAARRFAALGGRAIVVVAPSRRDAVEHAVASGADALVVDGPLSTRPERPALAVLAVDRERPWGAGQVLPRGDLRASPAALLGAADAVVPVDATPSEEDLARLRGVRFGLFTALGRPDRLVSALRRAGLEPVLQIAAPDHGPAPKRAIFDAAQRSVDVWTATPKCAVHLEHAVPPDRIHVLADTLVLPAELVRHLHTCVS